MVKSNYINTQFKGVLLIICAVAGTILNYFFNFGLSPYLLMTIALLAGVLILFDRISAVEILMPVFGLGCLISAVEFAILGRFLPVVVFVPIGLSSLYDGYRNFIYED